MSSAELRPLDAVFVDGFGTLVHLQDPIPALQGALAAAGTVRTTADVKAAFAAEVAYYRPRSLVGHDPQSLAGLRRRCVEVFLRHAGADASADDFIQPFMESLTFELTPGAEAALVAFRRNGLKVVCVANWDIGLHELLKELGVHGHFDAVVTSASVGVEKPDTRIFEHALEHAQAEPHRVVHIGDEDVDVDGAAAAGIRYEPPPLATLPVRLGLEATGS